MPDTPTTIDEYIAAQDPRFQPLLHQLRDLIKAEIPTAAETISYLVPTFKRHYSVVGFGVTQNTVSLYTMSPPLVAELAPELKQAGIKFSGSTLHFPLDKPLPADLIRSIIHTRLQADTDRFESRRKK